MSQIILTLIASQAFTFMLGLALGWCVWRLGKASDTTEIDFWRDKLKVSQHELWQAQGKLTKLGET